MLSLVRAKQSADCALQEWHTKWRDTEMLHLKSLSMSYVVAGRLLLLAYAVDQMQRAVVTYILYFVTAFSLITNT